MPKITKSSTPRTGEKSESRDDGKVANETKASKSAHAAVAEKRVKKKGGDEAVRNVKVEKKNKVDKNNFRGTIFRRMVHYCGCPTMRNEVEGVLRKLTQKWMYETLRLAHISVNNRGARTITPGDISLPLQCKGVTML